MDPLVEFLKVLAEFLAMTLGGAFLLSAIIVFGGCLTLYLVDSRKK